MDKFLRDKLSEDKFPYREEYWGEMEKLLEKEKKRRPTLFWWLGGIAIALAVITIVFFRGEVFPEMETNVHTELNAKTADPLETAYDEAKNASDENSNASRSDNQNKIILSTIEPNPNSAEQKVSSKNTVFNKTNPKSNNDVLYDSASEIENVLEIGMHGEPAREEELTAGLRAYNSGQRQLLLTNNESINEFRSNGMIRTVRVNTNSIIVDPVTQLASNLDLLERSVVVSQIPPVNRGSNGWHFGVQAGYSIYPSTMRSEIHTVQGPMSGLVLAKNMPGPWRISAAINYSNIRTEGSVIERKTESSFGFGKQDRTSGLSVKRLHLMDMPFMISRKTGPVWVNAGIGAEWLIGLRGNITDESRIPEYSLGNIIEQTKTEMTEKEIWVNDDFISNFRLFFRAGLDVPVATAFEFGLGFKYFASPLAQVNDSEIDQNIVDARSNFQIQAGIKYWIK